MFGKNAVSGPRQVADQFMVNELWYTIQGEGPWMGRPAIFLRLSKCNLRCYFCDTEFESGYLISVADLAAKVTAACRAANCFRVVITGGEPMLHPLGELIMRCPSPMTFQVETAGTVMPTISQACLQRMVFVVSPKTPKIHPEVEKVAHSYKYIIRAGECDLDDGLPIMSTQKPGEPARLFRPPALRAASIFVQPMDEPDIEAKRANITETAFVAMKFGYRVSLQMHKILGVD